MDYSFLPYGLIVLGYMLGAIPMGLLLTKLAGIGDLRRTGSGNIGATNVVRAGGKKLGALTLLLDAGKGALAVYIATLMKVENNVVLLTALMAVIGHMFPCWLKFKGGKGVATTLGVFLVLFWPLGLFCIGIWLAVFALTRISSVSAILMMISAPSVALIYVDRLGHGLLYLTLGLSILVVVKHHSNIRRLLQGEEKKIGSS